jgi:hypothetical protein
VRPKKSVKKHNLLTSENTNDSVFSFDGTDDWLDVSGVSVIHIAGNSSCNVEFSDDGINVLRSLVLHRESNVVTYNSITPIYRYFRVSGDNQIILT